MTGLLSIENEEAVLVHQGAHAIAVVTYVLYLKAKILFRPLTLLPRSRLTIVQVFRSVSYASTEALYVLYSPLGTPPMRKI